LLPECFGSRQNRKEEAHPQPQDQYLSFSGGYHEKNTRSRCDACDWALEIEKEIETKTVALGEPEQLADVRCNIARTLIRLHRYAEAENILLNIITQAGKFPQKTSYIHSMLGTIYSAENSSLYDSQKAIHYLNKSITESDEKHDMQDLTPYKLLAEVYDREGNVIESLTLLKRYITMTESKITDKEKELAEKMKSEKNIRKKEIETQLLTNIAPESIVNRMMNREKIADYFSSVSIIFIDIVNFTSLSQSIEPELLLEFLNTVFSAFDECAARYGVEKIKTIGDAYMAVAGIPKWTPDHAQCAANFACAILSLAPNIHSPVEGIPLSLRIGIACGEAIAGIIGTKRLSYDLWGDAVNTASRMESHGEAGKIHVSEEFVLALSLNRPSDTFSHWEKEGMRAIPRGEMDIKGKGTMRTYFLEKVSEP
jgi:class 3 adenylate cyclase